MKWIIKRIGEAPYFRGPELKGSVYTHSRHEAMRFDSKWEAYEKLAQCIRANHVATPRVVRIRTVSAAAKRERAIIVAWLRTLQDESADNCATMIERGKHVKASRT